MTENMTEKDIIKALECHKDERNNCKACPYREVGCSLKLTADVLDLINRKDARTTELTDEITKLKTENSRLYQENLELKDGFFQKHYKEAESQELMSVKEAWKKAKDDYIDLNAEWEGKYMTAKSDARKELTDKFLGILAWYESGFIETENWSARNTVVQIITELNKLLDEMETKNNEC